MNLSALCFARHGCTRQVPLSYRRRTPTVVLYRDELMPREPSSSGWRLGTRNPARLRYRGPSQSCREQDFPGAVGTIGTSLRRRRSRPARRQQRQAERGMNGVSSLLAFSDQLPSLVPASADCLRLARQENQNPVGIIPLGCSVPSVRLPHSLSAAYFCSRR